ncbi:PREDICTED: uncharacterized protein LOC107192025 [Dufourea novaeangliae]|uniref:uncharacterized protein LOC107192025 n=1 Tax=Dufourea novaeangliae TaxID=178035 RepID=UPI000767BADD|nr:PREDICTED: uncharacterized protein LOC107192025 [Dufourea novaeangliae]
MMLRASTLLLLFCINAGLSNGMECSLGPKNFLEKVIDSCPTIFDTSDKSFCCFNIENNKTYCCDATEFAMLSSWVLITVIVVVVIVLLLVGFCVSCLCCVFCRRHRRRYQGTVYGHAQVPRVVQVIHTPANIPQPNEYVTYPTLSTGMSQPPEVSNDLYVKQAPYNPNYV